MEEGRTIVTQAWRPQAFGRLRAGAIDDPIIEPLWRGDRALVIVTAPDARPHFIDEHGESFDDPQLLPIAADLEASLRADSVVLDGYLTRQPNVEPALAVTIGPPIPTPREVLGTFFFGRSRSRVARARDRASAAPPTDPSLPLTFMAVDLLAIDEQPLLDVPLLERKRILETAFEEAQLVRRSAYVRPPIDTFLLSWRAFGFVEVAYKGANSRYTPGLPNPGWAVAAIPTG